MKKIIRGILSILLLVSFVGCSSKVNVKEVLLNAFKNMALAENVYYVMDGNIMMSTSGFNITMDFDMTMWGKNIRTITEAEYRMDMILAVMGMKEEMHIYYKDGKTYLEQGGAKIVNDTPLDVDIESMTTLYASYNDEVEKMFDQLALYFDIKGKKVAGGTQVTLKIKNSSLKLINEELTKSSDVQGEIKELNIVFVINDEEMFESISFIITVELQEQGTSTTVSANLDMLVEILDDNYEIEYPDLREFVELETIEIEEIEVEK